MGVIVLIVIVLIGAGYLNLLGGGIQYFNESFSLNYINRTLFCYDCKTSWRHMLQLSPCSYIICY